MGGDRAPQLRRLIDHRAHQFATGAASGDGDASRLGYALGDQVAGDVHEIVEGVGAFGQLAGFVPVVAQFIAAANMGDGEDEAAIEQREPIAGERRHDAVAVGAVAVEIERCRTVGRRVFSIDQRDGDAYAISRRRNEAFGNVVRRIVARADLTHLAGLQAVVRQVVLEHGAGRDHRGIVQSHGVAGELAVVA